MQRFQFLPLLVLIAGCGSRAPVAIPGPGPLQKLPPGSHQQTAEIPGLGSVRYAIEIPGSYDGQAPVPLVLLLHYGYDGPKPDPCTGKEMIDAFRSGLSGLRGILVAPDALGGRWTDAANEQVVVWLTKSVRKTYAIDPKRVVITGFSLGGEGTWFIGSRHQDVFTGAMPVAAPVPSGQKEWSVPVYVIHSDGDQVVPFGAAKQHANALQGSGAKVVFKPANGLSHYDTGAYATHVREGVEWLQGVWK